MATQRMILGEGLINDSKAKEALEDYTKGAGDREVILELYQTGKLNDCVIEIDRTLYRGILLTKKRMDKEMLEGEGYGSFSEDRGVAWEFAKTLVEEDVANIILEVNPDDVEVVIDMQKVYEKYGVSDEGCLFSMKHEKEHFVIYNKAKLTLV